MSNEVMISDKPLTAQIAEIACNFVVTEFIQGQQDCKEGKAHIDGNGDSYDAGYGAQYELEQINSVRFK